MTDSPNDAPAVTIDIGTPTAADTTPSINVEKQQESAQPPLQPIDFHGIAVSSGVAIGRAQLLSEGDLEIPHFTIEKTDVRSESIRLRNAFNTVIKELESLVASTSDDTPSEATAIINMYLQVLHDDSLITQTQEIIGERLVNAEWALALKLESVKAAFDAIDDNYLAERGNDIMSVCERVQRVLTGRRSATDSVEQSLGDDGVILLATDLNPADILILKRRYDESINGLVIETGSATSHTAILARSLEIPALVGVIGITKSIHSGDLVYVDTGNSTVTVHPNVQALTEIRNRIRELKQQRNRLKRLKSTPAVTKDGVALRLLANIALPEDIEDAVQAGADGVGLFRSEFLFMNRNTLPSEDEQYEAYRRVIRPMKEKTVIIRTMDIGGDKRLDDEVVEDLVKDPIDVVINPALGRRALRFCRSFPELFDTQLRAILRAAVDSNTAILLPMVTHPSEIDFARDRIRQAEAALKERGVKYRENIRLGAMIEVPAAAIWLQPLLSRVDFVSLGTNDLIQYTLAVDRHDASVGYLYSPWHPAVLHLIGNAVKVANQAKKPIGICGEIAGDPNMLGILLGIGLRNFSMESSRILALKERVLVSDASEMKRFVIHIRRMRNLEKASLELEAFHKKESSYVSPSS